MKKSDGQINSYISKYDQNNKININNQNINFGNNSMNNHSIKMNYNDQMRDYSYNSINNQNNNMNYNSQFNNMNYNNFNSKNSQRLFRKKPPKWKIPVIIASVVVVIGGICYFTFGKDLIKRIINDKDKEIIVENKEGSDEEKWDSHQKELLEKIKKESQDDIIEESIIFEDYNNDGKKELFCLTGQNGHNPKITNETIKDYYINIKTWYAAEDGIKKCFEDEAPENIKKEGVYPEAGYKLNCYTVKVDKGIQYFFDKAEWRVFWKDYDHETHAFGVSDRKILHNEIPCTCTVVDGKLYGQAGMYGLDYCDKKGRDVVDDESQQKPYCRFELEYKDGKYYEYKAEKISKEQWDQFSNASEMYNKVKEWLERRWQVREVTDGDIYYCHGYICYNFNSYKTNIHGSKYIEYQNVVYKIDGDKLVYANCIDNKINLPHDEDYIRCFKSKEQYTTLPTIETHFDERD